MKIIVVSVLVLASVAAGQLIRGDAVVNTRAEASAAAAPAPVEPAPAAAGAAKSTGSQAAPAAPQQPQFPPEFFGPGINNPIARAPLPSLVARAREVVASNPNVRVFVDVDGTVEFTDQFGREVEVLDSFGRDALDVPGLEEQLELQRQQQKIEQRRQLVLQQLAALDSLSGRTGGQGGAAAAGPSFVITQ